MGPSGVRRNKTIGNIGIYHPCVFCVRYGFIRYFFTTFRKKVKGGIVSSRVKLIQSIKQNQIMDQTRIKLSQEIHKRNEIY